MSSNRTTCLARHHALRSGRIETCGLTGKDQIEWVRRSRSARAIHVVVLCAGTGNVLVPTRKILLSSATNIKTHPNVIHAQHLRS